MPEGYELTSRHKRNVSMISTALDMTDDTRHTNASARSSTDSARDELDTPIHSRQDSHSLLNHASTPRHPDHNPFAHYPTGRLRRLALPSRRCTNCLFLLLISICVLLGIGRLVSFQRQNQAQQTSLVQEILATSEAWYPTPRGGTVAEWVDSFAKASKLVARMSLVEKVNLTTGTGWKMNMCVGNTGPVERLNFPSLCLQDGPLGIRFADHITAFPAGLTVGATWNKELMYARGRALGEEARLKGVNVLLGPSMGPIGKLPAGGRNWEGFGADPVLQAYASAITIEGIQDEGVMATAKHYVANEQEHFHQAGAGQESISTNIDDRTLHEIYAWPFGDAIRAGVASVMCSYNQVNNSYACHNSKLINGILKDELGFQGFVQSDWLAQRSGVESALAGLDMSMPGDSYEMQDGKPFWGPELTKAVLNGTVPVERVDDMALRIVAAWYQLGQDDVDKWPRGDNGGPNFSSWTWEEHGPLHPGADDGTQHKVNHFIEVQGDHHNLARKIVAEGTVLVKNDEQILPLASDGHAMTRDASRPFRLAIYGEDAFPNPQGANACEDRSCNEYTLGQAWGSGSVEYPYLMSPVESLRSAFVTDTVQMSEYPSNQPDLSGASSQDMCLVFINSDAGEGYLSWQDVKGDRNDLYAQKGGDQLVQDVAERCGDGSAPVVVVVHAVGPVILEKWIDIPNVKAVLLAHLPGQESGNGLTDVLLGYVNPSGRLPYTIGRSEDDYGPTSRILTESSASTPQQDFTERMYFDYRYFDAFDKKPRYEFGFGLSYTTFRISGIEVTPMSNDRTALPALRRFDHDAPKVNRRIPPAEDSVVPTGFRRLARYIYPYIDSILDARPKGTYRYPDGYAKTQKPSRAGGGPGGNPDLYRPMVVVKGQVENLGSKAGSCVVQLYIAFPRNMRNSLDEVVDMPPRVLRRYKKIALEPYQTDRSKIAFTMELNRRDLSYWDRGLQNWVVPTRGAFTVWLGQSSRWFDKDSSAVIPFSNS